MPIYPMNTSEFFRGVEGTDMLEQLSANNKVVGAKQAKRALNDGRAKIMFLANDADPRVVEPLKLLAAQKGVPVVRVPTMQELGSACGISVGSAVAVTI